MTTRSTCTQLSLLLLLFGCSQPEADTGSEAPSDPGPHRVIDAGWTVASFDLIDAGSPAVGEVRLQDGSTRTADGGVGIRDDGPTITTDAGGLLGVDPRDPDCGRLCYELEPLECELVAPSGTRIKCADICPHLLPAERRCLDHAMSCDEVERCVEASHALG